MKAQETSSKISRNSKERVEVQNLNQVLAAGTARKGGEGSSPSEASTPWVLPLLLLDRSPACSLLLSITGCKVRDPGGSIWSEGFTH